MSYLFIVNPVAGKNRGKKIIPIIHEVMERNNCPYEVRVTKNPGDATIFAKESRNQNFDVIVSVGGDGTVQEVLNGIIDSSKVLGIIPAGTGNDLGRTLNLPMNPRQAMEVLIKGNRTKIDLGKMNENYFINFVGMGLDAFIVEEANKIKKYFSNTYSYVVGVLKGLIKFKDFYAKFNIDGTDYEENVMLIAVCNGAYYGGGMKIAPEARIQDGYFDICVIKKLSKLKILFLFPTIFKGKHVHYSEVKIYRGKQITVTLPNHISVNADGEAVDHRPIELKIEEKKLEVIVP